MPDHAEAVPGTGAADDPAGPEAAAAGPDAAAPQSGATPPAAPSAATPPAATPSAAVHSDATPPDATPSAAVPSDATPPTPPGRVELLADLDRPGAWVLLVDDVIQSHVDLDDPHYLDLQYVRWLGHLVDLAGPPGAPLRVLHLGGGGLTLARYVAATRPGSPQLAVEADAELAELVRIRLPLGQPARRSRGGRAQPGRIRVRIGDARTALEQLPPGSFDVLVADIFTGAQTPAHLTSAEFTALAARVVAPHGLFAVNVGDGPPLAHVRARVATIRAVFPLACLIAEAAVLNGRGYGNLVIAASAGPIPVTELARRTAADPIPRRLIHGAALDRFAAGSRPITDSTAKPSPPPPPGVFA